MSNAIKDWFPLYAGDWLTSMGLRLCSPVARGILIDLMAYSWQTGEPGVIADEHHDLALFFHCTEETFSNAIAELALRNCIVRDNGKIIIKRLQVIAGEQIGKHELRRKAGRKGGLAKAENMRSADDDSSNALASSSNALAVEEKRVDKKRKEESEKRTVPVDEIKSEWNRLCESSGLKKIAAWTSDRNTALSARWKEAWFRESWQEIFTAAHQAEWCRKNKAGIEHVLRPKNALRYYEDILAGKTNTVVDPYEGITVLN